MRPSAGSAIPTAAEPSDGRLVMLVRHGDAHAFELLVRRHYATAFAVALAHTQDRHDAEDVCHDAFVRAAARLDECRSPDRFVHWLCAIVRNLARNVRARGFARRAVSLEVTLPPSDQNPDRDLEVSDLRRLLEGAMALLSRVEREVLFLHHIDGWTHDAIADLIGTSSGMSRQHLFKARKRLRQALGEHALREYFDD